MKEFQEGRKSKDLTPKSFRIDDNTAEKIREITGELGTGANTQEAFARMIEAYEIQKAKFALGKDSESVEEFEAHVNILSRLFMGMVEKKQMLSATVRTEYEAMLTSKEKTIQGLQEEMESLTESTNAALSETRLLREENTRLGEEIKELQNKLLEQQSDFWDKLADKDALNQTLNDSCIELREKNEQMKAAVSDAESSLKEKENLVTVVSDLERKIQELKSQIESRKKEAALEKEQALLEQQRQFDGKLSLLDEEFQKLETAMEKQKDENERTKDKLQLEMDKKLMETNRQFTEAMEEVKKKAQNEIDLYQEKYLMLLERMSKERENL